MLCDSCDCLFINGHKCHEHGCPDAWKDQVRECAECGCEYTPEDKDQVFCSNHCGNLHTGSECGCDVCFAAGCE